jgi:two-component system response regulator HydG
MIRGSIHEDDMVLADLRLPDGESTALLKWMRDNGYMHPFIMMTNYEEIHSAVHAMKLGAEDFILKPLVEDKLLPAIRKIKAANDTFSKVIYERRSASFCELNQYIHLVAPTDMTVLILGNTGTGKEHLANKIHRRSLRANKPYIKVDCGSLSKDLAASAFFGHVKGAFTGATEEKAGYFLEAQGGTLFMDEVENLSIETQRMLLRAMEERSYRPVGGKQDRRMDVRIIAATNEDLFQAVAEKRFRKDLLYRFHDFTITVPALQNCLEDILPLADFFREQSCAELRKEVVGFNGPAKEMLLGYSWPGNVRQLKQVVYAAVLICKGNLITPDFLRLKQTETDAPNSAKKKKIDRCLQKDEKRNIEQIKTAISISKGNLTQAAALLGISRPTLYKKMSIHGISK